MLSDFKEIRDQNISDPKEFAALVKSSASPYKGIFFSLNQVELSDQLIDSYSQVLEEELNNLRVLDDQERTGKNRQHSCRDDP